MKADVKLSKDFQKNRPAPQLYTAEKKSWYAIARNFLLLFLNFSAWPYAIIMPKSVLPTYAYLGPELNP